jgi:sulfur relay (sulfurtransferase) complex TusBCD TusD component (DsrE family)
MDLRGKKLGLLISTAPENPNFERGLKLAETAMAEGVDVYLYCIDNAVPGVVQPRVQALKERGLKLYACAYGAHKRNFPLSDQAAFAGLTVVNDLVASTDRFVSFN